MLASYGYRTLEGCWIYRRAHAHLPRLFHETSDIDRDLRVVHAVTGVSSLGGTGMISGGVELSVAILYGLRIAGVEILRLEHPPSKRKSDFTRNAFLLWRKMNVHAYDNTTCGPLFGHLADYPSRRLYLVTFFVHATLCRVSQCPRFQRRISQRESNREHHLKRTYTVGKV